MRNRKEHKEYVISVIVDTITTNGFKTQIIDDALRTFMKLLEESYSEGQTRIKVMIIEK